MTIAPLTLPKTFYGDDPPAAAGSPLSAAHFSEIEIANKRAKKIRRATRIAQTDAWICAIFAGLTLLSGLFSLSALLLGLGMAFCAFNAFRGAKRLQLFDSSAPRLLALNQLLLAAALILYAIYSLWAASHGKSAFAAAIAAEPGIASGLGNLEQLEWVIYVAIFGGLIIGTTIAQGLAAIYYITRRKHLAAYVAQTPAWILAMQKA